MREICWIGYRTFSSANALETCSYAGVMRENQRDDR